MGSYLYQGRKDNIQMKLQSCLMIKCIALNTIDIQELANSLHIYFKKKFPQAIINLRTN